MSGLIHYWYRRPSIELLHAISTCSQLTKQESILCSNLVFDRWHLDRCCTNLKNIFITTEFITNSEAVHGISTFHFIQWEKRLLTSGTTIDVEINFIEIQTFPMIIFWKFGEIVSTKVRPESTCWGSKIFSILVGQFKRMEY